MVRTSRSLAYTAVLLAAAASAGAGYGKSKPKSTPAPAAPPAPNPMAVTITADQKEITDDQAALAKANKDLADATNKLVADNDQTPEVAAAKKAITDAATAEQTARDKAMLTLKKDPAYQAAVAKEAAARVDLDKLRNADSPDQDAIAAKSTEAFNDGAAVSKLERASLDTDPAYAAADKKLAEANANLAALHTKFKDSIKNDPSLATLKTARDDAQTKLTAAQAKLDTDRKGGTASPATGGTASTK